MMPIIKMTILMLPVIVPLTKVTFQLKARQRKYHRSTQIGAQITIKDRKKLHQRELVVPHVAMQCPEKGLHLPEGRRRKAVKLPKKALKKCF